MYEVYVRSFQFSLLNWVICAKIDRFEIIIIFKENNGIFSLSKSVYGWLYSFFSFEKTNYFLYVLVRVSQSYEKSRFLK